MKKKDKGSLNDHSTDSMTPPTKNKLSNVTEVKIETEYFDVIYTKHLKQKQKIWEDGFLEVHP